MKIKYQLFLVLFLISNSIYSQNQYGQFTVSAGASYSALRGVHKLPFIKYEKDFDFTVGQQFHFDVAVIRRFSFGIGYTHQKHVLNIHDYEYFKGPAIITENPIQTTNVHAFYLRAIVHHHNLYEDSDEMFDLYAGAQQNFMFFGSKNNSLDPNFPQIPGVSITIPSFVVGLRYFPIDQFGIHIEGSIPGAYTVSFGLVFRNIGRDKVLKSSFWG